MRFTRSYANTPGGFKVAGLIKANTQAARAESRAKLPNAPSNKSLIPGGSSGA